MYRQESGSNQYNDQLKSVNSYGFPFNHLLSFSLMQRIPAPSITQNDYKEKFFFFVTLAPGKGEVANRTYDFGKTAKIVQKFSTRELIGFSSIIEQCAIGNTFVLPYNKFSKSKTESKHLSIWVASKQQQIGQNNVTVHTVNLTFKSGQLNYTIALTPDQALGIHGILKQLSDKAITSELNIQNQAPTINNTPVNYMPQPVTGYGTPPGMPGSSGQAPVPAAPAQLPGQQPFPAPGNTYGNK